MTRFGLLGAVALVGACGSQSREPIASSRDGGAVTAPGSTQPGTPPSFNPSAHDGGLNDAGCVDTSVTMQPMTDGTLGPAFTSLYVAYDLGPVPGVPGGVGQSLGGCTILPNEPNTLYVVGDSEQATSALFKIKIKRDACKHITGFDGAATEVATIPYADANLLYSSYGWLYSMFPVAKIGQLTASINRNELDLNALGLRGPYVYNANDQFPGESPGGMAVVPADLAAGGSLVVIAYPSGDFYHLSLTTTGGVVQATYADKGASLPNGPGAFAYVPKGSPGFAASSLIVTEWFAGPAWKSVFNDPPDGTPQAVAVYEVDDQGTPKPTTRRPFFSQFPRPWGAFFEPLTGDFLFATWRGSFGAKPDRIVQVRGFTAPPPTPVLR